MLPVHATRISEWVRCCGVPWRLAAAALLALQACAGGGQVLPPAAPAAVAPYTAFGPPQLVTIRHYGGDAMEPFITRDGRYLLFNNRNGPRTDTSLHVALRMDDLTFDYRGRLDGADSPVLGGVPSTDREGRLFFISTRGAGNTPMPTLWRGRLSPGGRGALGVAGIEPVPGVAPRRPGTVLFNAEVSADGATLLLVDGEFGSAPVPRTADISLAVRDGDGFRRLPASHRLMQHVNTAALEYAAALSADALELFFTRADSTPGQPPAILRSQRGSAQAPFDPPQPVAAITGWAEAPALSPDGRALYYHKLEGAKFVIYRIAR
jgi:hypothetical protein